MMEMLISVPIQNDNDNDNDENDNARNNSQSLDIARPNFEKFPLMPHFGRTS